MKAIILAAGKGKRMHSSVHKVLHPILGKPMLLYITGACMEAGIDDITVVIGHDGESVRKALPDSIRCVTQEEPKGTGHAVIAARAHILPEDDVLVLYGDTPLITAAFLRKLAEYQRKQKSDAVVTSVVMPEPYGYGRVLADDNNVFIKIIEQADLNENDENHLVKTVNTGVCVFKGDALLYGLDRLTSDNKQGEYYLTDVPAILRGAGRNVIVYRAKEDPSVFSGINTQAQLAEASRNMRGRINLRHMENGVRIMDPVSTFIDSDVVIAPEVTLYPGVILEGHSHIESGAVIGPNTRIVDSTVGEGSAVQYSVLTEVTVGSHVEIGPFAHLRMHTEIGSHSNIGNFVEIKNAHTGHHVKARHLSYIGDAEVGSHVNVGCGAITVNYDGKHKHRTVIEDNAFIGCNSNLIAPVTIGENAFVAAGSTITEDAPANALAIARERQVNKPDWNNRT